MNITTDEFNAMYSDWITPNTVILEILLAVGVFGNTFAFLLYKFCVPYTEERFFIPYLAVVDLFVCVWGGSFSLILNFYRANFPDAVLCKVMYYFTWGSINFSALLLLIIAFHRYKRICRPISPQWSEHKRRIAVGGGGIFSFILTIPILLLFGEKRGNIVHQGTNVTVVTCNVMSFTRDESFIYMAFSILYFIILMTAIIILYSLIGVTIFRTFQVRASRKIRKLVENNRGHNSIMSEDTNISTVDKSVTSNIEINGEPEMKRHFPKKKAVVIHVRHNFTGMFAAIIMFWVVSYLPTITLIIIPAAQASIEFWFHKSAVTINILLFLKRAFMLNHVVNPFIYGYFDVGFRKEAYKLFCFWRRP